MRFSRCCAISLAFAFLKHEFSAFLKETLSKYSLAFLLSYKSMCIINQKQCPYTSSKFLLFFLAHVLFSWIICLHMREWPWGQGYTFPWVMNIYVCPDYAWHVNTLLILISLSYVQCTVTPSCSSVAPKQGNLLLTLSIIFCPDKCT